AKHVRNGNNEPMTPAFRANYTEIDWSKPIEISRPEPGTVQRSAFPCPRIASDVMEPVQSMATGRMHDSKASLRAEYKRMGMIEVGNDPARLRPRVKPKPDRRAIRQTIEKAQARFNRGERVNK
ncbi:MAG: hypothetical protein JWR61_5873, partial [Ferruginibacter sp.]|uniref:hypothetical protein n=1 Tax=Ferruginibacter sp. TaxID=1940288 RepID=UPI00265898FC